MKEGFWFAREIGSGSNWYYLHDKEPKKNDYNYIAMCCPSGFEKTTGLELAPGQYQKLKLVEAAAGDKFHFNIRRTRDGYIVEDFRGNSEVFLSESFMRDHTRIELALSENARVKFMALGKPKNGYIH